MLIKGAPSDHGKGNDNVDHIWWFYIGCRIPVTEIETSHINEICLSICLHRKLGIYVVMLKKYASLGVPEVDKTTISCTVSDENIASATTFAFGWCLIPYVNIIVISK